VDRIFTEAGGAEALFGRGQRILIKPNLVSPVHPGLGFTTNPQVVQAVIEQLQTVTNQIFVGDSPAIGRAEAVFAKAEITQVIKKTGAFFADFDTPEVVAHPGGKQTRQLIVAKACLEFDHYISLPKLKIHPLFEFTGALKNQYGIVPGLRKARGHMQFPTHDSFANMLVDLNTWLRPDWALMDAVFGIEGDSLRAAEPRKIGLLLAGKDLTALDATACRLIGLDPTRIPVIRQARNRDFGVLENELIEIIGGDLHEYIVPDFKKIQPIQGIEPLRFFPPWLRESIYRSVLRTPRIDQAKCQRCLLCVNICPAEPKSLLFTRQKVETIAKLCRRCYCCYEVCPHGALSLQPGFLGKIFFSKS